MTTSTTRYPNLFSPWSIRNTRIDNRVVFAPTCPTWVTNPYEGTFNDQAVAYYEERAKHGLGLIIIGGTLISRDTLYTPLLFPGLWEDHQIDGMAAVAEAVHKHGCKLACQLLHVGQRTVNGLKTDPGYDYDATWYQVGPSQIATGEYPGAPTPKELEEHEIQQILDDYEAAARRAIAAGLDGVEFHMAHGYLPWQFLSPLYNHRNDRWGGSYENRLRLPVEALRRVRAAIGEQPFLGYRLNSTSFWDGDLEADDVAQIVSDVQQQTDTDYVNVSAGVHHSYIHTPMDYPEGWERGYTRKIKDVSTKPVLLVGRFTSPAAAEEALAAGDGDAVLLARQMFADAAWVTKTLEGREEDIRQCVAANYCWRNVIQGARVQCVYNPTVGRERHWGEGSLIRVDHPRRVLVIGGGPAGLEFARVAAARGHRVTVYERAVEIGGHTRAHGALPSRERYGEIGRWLGQQAQHNGAKVHLGTPITTDNLSQVLRDEAPDHVVLATGSRQRKDGFQGQTGQPIPGWESGNCTSWDEVALGEVTPFGSVLVVDDLQDTAAPLTAVMLARAGHQVRLLTRWPMVAMDTMPDVYLHWMLTYLYQADVEIVCDHWITRIDGGRVEAVNVYRPDAVRPIDADWVVMATARQSERDLYAGLLESGISVETIGDATAPRGTYEATYEGHRAARKV